jgi:hypothetical protein
MKTMLVALGLFVLGFGGIVAFSGGQPGPLFGAPDLAASPDDDPGPRLVTLGDHGDAVEIAYQRMLRACKVEDRKAYSRAMNGLAVAKRHSETGKIERGNIGDRVPRLMAQFVEAVRKGVITNDHVPFGSLRSIVVSTQKRVAAGMPEPEPEPISFTLRGSIGDAGVPERNDCKVL